MKTLYLECNMGAAGDMLMGALLELIPDREKFLKKLNQAGLPHVKVSANPGSEMWDYGNARFCACRRQP